MNSDATTWMEVFQKLLYYYRPPIPRDSIGLNVACLAAILAGVMLAFRSAKYSRVFVCYFAVIMGAWIGYKVCVLIGTPGEPIGAALGAVALTILAYRTYRFWLAAGSVVVLFALATVFELGRGDLSRYIPKQAQVEEVTLPTPEGQQANWQGDFQVKVDELKQKMLTHMQQQGPMGWLIPAAAAVVGALLAFWALQVFAVIWMGLLGALMAVGGLCTFLMIYQPDMQQWFITQPMVPVWCALGIWLLGLVLQAKEARLPKPQAAAERKGGEEKE